DVEMHKFLLLLAHRYVLPPTGALAAPLFHCREITEPNWRGKAKTFALADVWSVARSLRRQPCSSASSAAVAAVAQPVSMPGFVASALTISDSRLCIPTGARYY